MKAAKEPLREGQAQDKGSEGTEQRLRLALRRLDELRDELARAQNSLETLAEEGSSLSCRLGFVRYGKGNHHNRVERVVLNSLDVEREIQELKAEEAELLAWIEPLVNLLPPGIRRAIVKLRFVDGASCAAIGWKLHYSRSFVYKALDEGIRRMGSLEAQPLKREV